jgi:hypothetical protein
MSMPFSLLIHLAFKSHAHGPLYAGIAAEPRHGAAANEQPGSQKGSCRPQGGGG